MLLPFLDLSLFLVIDLLLSNMNSSSSLIVDNFLPLALLNVSLSYSTADLISSSYSLISSGGMESNPYFLLLGVAWYSLRVGVGYMWFDGRFEAYNAIDTESDSRYQTRKS